MILPTDRSLGTPQRYSKAIVGGEAGVVVLSHANAPPKANTEIVSSPVGSTGLG